MINPVEMTKRLWGDKDFMKSLANPHKQIVTRVHRQICKELGIKTKGPMADRLRRSIEDRVEDHVKIIIGSTIRDCLGHKE